MFRHKFTNIETCMDQPVGTNIPDTSHTRWGRMEVESDNGIKKEENNLSETKDYNDRNKLGGGEGGGEKPTSLLFSLL